jgi:hypothetical protein
MWLLSLRHARLVSCARDTSGLDSQGFTAGCHAVSREVRKIFLLGSSSPQGAGTTDVGGQAQAVDPQLRTLVMSACVALAGYVVVCFLGKTRYVESLL